MAYLSTVGVAVKKEHFDKQFAKFKQENKNNRDFNFIVDFIEKGCTTFFVDIPDTKERVMVKIWENIRWDSESDYAYNNEKPLPEVQAVIDICFKDNDEVELMRFGDDELDYEHINTFKEYQFFDYERRIKVYIPN